MNLENHKLYSFFNLNSIKAVKVRLKEYCKSKNFPQMSAKCLISGDIDRVLSVKLELSSFLTISFDEVSLNDLGQERLEHRRIKQLAEVMCEIYNYRTWNDRV